MIKEHATVMVIEGGLNSIGSMLQQCGYQVIEEESLSQAIEDINDFTNRFRPDLILLDLDRSRPEESWMVNMLQLGAKESDLPIIGFGEISELLKPSAKETGFTETISRHHGMRRLTSLIDGLLERN